MVNSTFAMIILFLLLLRWILLTLRLLTWYFINLYHNINIIAWSSPGREIVTRYNLSWVRHMSRSYLSTGVAPETIKERLIWFPVDDPYIS